MAEPTSISVETFGTEKVPAARIEEIVRQRFDLTPYGIITGLDLIRPIYQPLSALGHFGRTDLDLSWEALDRVEELRADAGL